MKLNTLPHSACKLAAVMAVSLAIAQSSATSNPSVGNTLSPGEVLTSEFGDLASNYIGEGQHDLVLTRPDGRQQLLWRSFSGIFHVMTAPPYLVVQDKHRFGMLSPVLVYRVGGESLQLIYHTPGNFSLEAMEFTYAITSIDPVNHELVVALVKHEYSDLSSRPRRTFIGEIEIKDLSEKRPIIPRFFNVDDPLYVDPNSVKQKPR